MSKKFDDFIVELRELCLKHGVSLNSYEPAGVFELEEGEDPVAHVWDETDDDTNDNQDHG